MLEEVVFLDTNVFMYAAGAAHALKHPCVRILSEVEQSVFQAAINSEVLQEILYPYSHLGMMEKGAQLCRIVMKYPLIILPVTAEDIRSAIDLSDANRDREFQPRDLVHAATMNAHGISQLISADQCFDRIPDIMRIDPLKYSVHK